MIAAEIALAQDVATRGQWTAYAAMAATDAVLFAPRLVWAGPWLKGRANPPAPLRRQPHEAWSSCDGSLVVSRGAWQQDRGGTGRFTTIWQRQPNGNYKWALDFVGVVQPVPPAPEMLSAHIADCPERRPRREAMGGPDKVRSVKRKDLPPLDPARHAGAAGDGSLTWEAATAPDGSRRLSVTWKTDGAEVPLLAEQVP